jgi:predicted PurR-regulated permease PerM
MKTEGLENLGTKNSFEKQRKTPSMISSYNQTSGRSINGGWITLFIVVAALYLARVILIPITLAILFAFLLQPLARRFERLRLGRVGSVLAAVIIAMFLGAALTELVAWQLGDLGKKLPEYEANIHKKLQEIKSREGIFFGHAAKSIQDFRKDLILTNSASLTNSTDAKSGKQIETKPVPVEVHDPETSPVQVIRNLLGPLVNLLTTLFLVAALCIFILVARDDLRTRVIRIVGSRNVKVTNEVIEDVGRRLSHYLLMQLFINACYGVSIGLGLWFIGIPNPLLWGMISGLFRYIPYAGPWIAASMPLAIGFAINSDWGKPFMVLGLFAAMEILTANFIEPWLYGNSTGITALAILLAAVFWTWVWGPVGLLLSIPLTVCLVSIARYVPQLELLEQLFGETETKHIHRRGRNHTPVEMRQEI